MDEILELNEEIRNKNGVQFCSYGEFSTMNAEEQEPKFISSNYFLAVRIKDEFVWEIVILNESGAAQICQPINSLLSYNIDESQNCIQFIYAPENTNIGVCQLKFLHPSASVNLKYVICC